MKSNLTKFAQMAILGLALTFTFSCSSGGDGGDDDTGGGGGSLGNNLTLSGQVYIRQSDFETMSLKYTPYTGSDKIFKSNTKETGSIKSGKMFFSAGIPNASLLEPFEDDVNDGDIELYPDAKVEPSYTKGIGLEFLNIELIKENINMDLNTGSMTIESVSFIYVDRDCTITATGGTSTEDDITFTYQDLNLKLEKGWNAINMNIRTSMSGAGTGTYAINIGDLPSCKWALDDGYIYGSSKKLSQFAKTSKFGIQRAITASLRAK